MRVRLRVNAREELKVQLIGELTSEGAGRRAAPALDVGERELRRQVLGGTWLGLGVGLGLGLGLGVGLKLEHEVGVRVRRGAGYPRRGGARTWLGVRDRVRGRVRGWG